MKGCRSVHHIYAAGLHPLFVGRPEPVRRDSSLRQYGVVLWKLNGRSVSYAQSRDWLLVEYKQFSELYSAQRNKGSRLSRKNGIAASAEAVCAAKL
jgi:hypothetical protein